ncbi:MAG: GEVED domain-containing protein [Saprospiraceae bacterium]|nr:GEVED domain-containing protein [Saprospiraceae bacterium]
MTGNRFALCVGGILCVLGSLMSQQLSPIATALNEQKQWGSFVDVDLMIEVQDPFLRLTHSAFVDNQTYLELDRAVVADIAANRPNLLRITITTRRQPLTLELFRKDLFTDSYRISTSEGPAEPRTDMVFYRGTIAGNANSLAVVSVIGDEVRMLLSDNSGNRRIQRTDTGRYTLFKDTDLKLQQSYECFVDETLLNPEGAERPAHGGLRTSSTGDCVEIYFECDLESYLDNNSSIADTEAWVAALFNEVSTIYDNENIPLGISEIFIWTTPDPYINLTSTSAALNEFVDQIQQNGYNGRLAHLLSTRGLGGGIAYVDVLCSTSIPCAVSASLGTNVVPFPNYSWNVMVIAHELGHNFGSRHTHRCWWNGNNTQIDDCGNEWANNNGNTPEGAACYDENNPILPTGTGGTIMSYCHLVSGVGINFNNGFGTQPGDLVYNEFITAPCNTGSCGAPLCTDLVSPAPGSSGVEITEDIAWAEVFGANGYILNVGTTAGGGQIVNDVDVGDVTVYDPGMLPADQLIHVLITPYNLAGNATGCSVQTFTTEAGGPPQCTQLTSPVAGSVDVDLDTDLVWAHAAGAQLGYKVNVGLTPGGGELANDVDVGNVTTYDPGTFPLDEEIFVRITPYGSAGDVTGCPVESFHTINNLVYCGSQGNIITDEWIGSFSFGSFTNTSGASQYSDYTNLIIPAAIGGTYAVSMTPEFSGQTWNEYFRVWIDFNKDGEFDDPGEEVFSDGPTTTNVSGTYTIPATALLGTTRLRVSMKYNGFPGPCETFSYGEVEDYTIEIGCHMVTTTADSGPGSLPDVLDCVAPGDTIYFSDDLNGQAIQLLSAPINIAKQVTIMATPGQDLSIEGMNALRVFDIALNGNVLIEGVTIVAGVASMGGAIKNTGNLVLKDVIIQQHPGQSGLSVVQNTGTLTLDGNCVIENQ